MENTDLGRKIALLRKERNWTQEMLAQVLGVSNQAVSKWESGICCPDVLLLPEIADQFGISLDELFGRESNSARSETGGDAADEKAAEGNASKGIATENGVKIVDGELPWKDDGRLRAVLFVGRTYQGHQEVDHSRDDEKYVNGQDHWQKIKDLKDGKICADDGQDPYLQEKLKIEFHYTGRVLDVYSDFAVTISDSTIRGNVTARGAVTCEDVGGDVYAGDGVVCENVEGDVAAGDEIVCGNVGGDAAAGDGVTCDDVGGNVSAGESVVCGDVGGNVSAGDCVTCGEVGGNVFAGDVN
ncbi:MAG: helix-turn-helix transcriptional regulator [Lachnospiraceae bacterium]|nr:helix-turn-helix transcriptional regulator [Lachnospiraceae bacterium]